jgi:tRNA-dihydrouridine synthase
MYKMQLNQHKISRRFAVAPMLDIADSVYI